MTRLKDLSARPQWHSSMAEGAAAAAGSGAQVADTAGVATGRQADPQGYKRPEPAGSPERPAASSAAAPAGDGAQAAPNGKEAKAAAQSSTAGFSGVATCHIAQRIDVAKAEMAVCSFVATTCPSATSCSQLLACSCLSLGLATQTSKADQCWRRWRCQCWWPR